MAKLKISARKTTNSAKSGKDLSRGCLSIFFLLFLVAGSFAFFSAFLRPLFQIIDARDWPRVNCKILSSEVKANHDDDGVTYAEHIEFQYDYEGRTYTSDKYRFMSWGLGWRSGKEEIVKQYPPGLQTICYVNPRKPDLAVINRDISGELFLGLFTLLFVAVGGVGLAVMIFKKPKPQAADDQFEWIPTDPQGAAHGDPRAPRVLKAQATPFVTFVVSVLICLFWNGIVSIFVAVAVGSFMEGDPNWFMSLFLIPFVLIGLAIAAFVIHSFLALFNPRPVITMVTPELWLGGMIALKWSFEGNVTRIRKLSIHLQGQERATYRRGTTTHTDTETFAKIRLTETEHAASIASGESSAEIPLRSMHSFKTNHNEISWSLVIDGDIAFWPNVSQRFNLVVLPAPVSE